jgi:hypothetical protein
MIHHISIAAHNPLHVAQVLAELWQGDLMPFPGHEGSYIALAYDAYGTLIEVLPKGTELMPATVTEGGQFAKNLQASAYTATHVAISVPIDEVTIQAIAKREGWLAKRCDRQGYFEVIEFWVENQVLVELLTPEIASKYLAITQPEALKQFAATASSAG